MKTIATRALAVLCLLSLSLSAPHAEPAHKNAAVVFARLKGAPIVIGRSYKLYSRALHDRRTINVYLPESYNDASREFPVLFLLDGGQHEDFLHIAGLAQITSAYGAGQEMIVIGIEGKDRRHDLTSASSNPDDLKVAPTSGGADDYRQFLVDELRPWVAARYRTNGRTALMGESLAGLFILETLLKRPASFSDYIAVSPSLWWDRGRVVRDAQAGVRNISFAGQRLWTAFEEPAPPPAAAAIDRRRQTDLETAFKPAHANQLACEFVHMAETHLSIYHPAALRAFRDLYGKSTP